MDRWRKASLAGIATLALVAAACQDQGGQSAQPATSTAPLPSLATSIEASPSLDLGSLEASRSLDLGSFAASESPEASGSP